MIKNIFIKPNSTDKTMTSVGSISVTTEGIVNHIPSRTYRQILILPIEVLSNFNLNPMDLKENLLVDVPFDLHSLESGTVLQIGEVKIRLTFHCEPCGKIKNVVNIKKIEYNRGYLGVVLNKGEISIGDKVTVLEEKYESIPYKLSDRIKWYLDSIDKPIFVSELVLKIGLSKSYCRAIPALIKKRNDIDKRKILYKKDRTPSLF